ncbi:hypothetical protein EV360DRAFT_74912 [Lentinula raphanica]|nr:hypothetical protein EV360DRAFT_74912 [Lentinula raphanica]
MALTSSCSSSQPPGRNTQLVVPHELLAQISLFSPPLSFLSPANYTQVCSQWRAVARALPEIWTTLTVETPTKLVQTRTDVISFEAALTDWISCSSNLTIDFTIRDRPNSRRFSPEDWDALYVRVYKRIVVRYSNKWRRLITPNSWNAWNFLSKFQTQPTLSALEELTISVHVQTGWRDYSKPPFLGSKHLHKLHLNISNEDHCCFLGDLISETVNVLTVNSAGHRGLYIWILFATTSGSGPATAIWDDHFEESPRACREWEHLWLMWAAGYADSTFFALTGLSPDDWHQAMAFSSLFDILSIDAASTIQELHIQSDVRFRQPITASLMEMLCYDSENPSNQILPHLTTFSAYDLYDSSLPAQSFFADFVHSRWWPDDSKRRMPGVAKLERVVLKSCRLTQTTEERLRICCEGGLSDKWPDANQFADTCDRWFQAV